MYVTENYGFVVQGALCSATLAASHELTSSSLADALHQLEAGLGQSDDDPLNELLRDGVIQRFEYSHELALKMLKRVLEVVFGDSVDTMRYNDLLRTAFERGLIIDVEKWIAYREARNQTSHLYDRMVAEEIFSCTRPFLTDARELLLHLRDAVHSPPA